MDFFFSFVEMNFYIMHIQLQRIYNKYMELYWANIPFLDPLKLSEILWDLDIDW